MKKHSPLVVGNWKMNPATLASAKKLFVDICTRLGSRPQHVKPVIAPPFPFISEIERLSPSKRIDLAAQDVFFESIGAHTGEVSVPMLKSVGVSMVIVGHSERRARGESDDEIYRDVQAVLKAKVSAIICVGEQVRDQHGNYFGVVEAQVRAALRDVSEKDLKRIIFAYEPVWAIGTGATASAADAHEMKLFIQKLLTDRYSRSAAESVRILYGGSVKKKNAAELLHVGGVDGFLIGGASLRAAEFAHIITIAEDYAKTHAT
jgi:triosephosphate isomerase